MSRYFHTHDNRVNYGEVLAPAPGYELDFAVGMTYSLDLEAFLSIPVFLSCSDNTEDMNNSPYRVLDAIKRVGEKIVLFCNGDGIKYVNPKNAPFFAMIEDCVYPVSMSDKHYFHPKLWVIRYKKENKPDKLRVIVLSRNLTFDRSLDIAVTLDADVVNENHAENQGLADIVRFAAKKMPRGNKRNQTLGLAESIERAGLFDCGRDFDSYRFIPFGIDGHKKESEAFFIRAYDLIVVSPFLSDSIISKMADATLYNKKIITRITAASQKVFDSFGEVWVPKDGILTDEILEETSVEETKRDLHAKIIYRTTPSGNFLHLGSLNATANAFYRNVEFMLELKYKPYHGGIGTLCDDLLPDENCVFRKLYSPSQEADGEREEEFCDFSDVVRAIKSAQVEETDDGYRLTVYSRHLDSDVEIAPMFKSEAFIKFGEEAVFDKLQICELSCFYIVKRDNEKRIIKIQTDGIPLERDDVLFNSILQDKAGFFAYLLFLLSGGQSEASFQQEDFRRLLSRKDNDRVLQTLAPSLYERLLRAAAEGGDKIQSVADIAERVAPDMIDNTLKDLIDLIKNSIRKRR